jgi:hypothetical protein
MEYFSKKNIPQTILAILFIIFLIMNYKIPENLASIIDTTIGKIIIVFIVLILFAYSNPILGVLSLLVAYQLIYRATSTTGLGALQEYYPTEEKKWSPFTPTHQFPYTLEQEVVKNMTTQKFNTTYTKTPYKPILDDTYDAAPLYTL